MGKIRAVIFDMDGVLVDAKDWHYEALNRALNHFGCNISRHDHLVTYDGLPTFKKLQILSTRCNLSVDTFNIINKMKQEYTEEYIKTKCKPNLKHIYALNMLKNQGYMLALASNSMRNTVDLIMEKTCLKKYFEFSLSNQDVINPKPDPEIYNKAIEKLKLYPNECLVLEDNKNGIQAAIESGANVLKIESVDDVNYDNIIKKIKEIENCAYALK